MADRKNPNVYFDQILQAWLWKTARESSWRFPEWYGPSDLVNDGIICYCKCRDRYTLADPAPGYQNLNTDAPDEAQRQHFMSLVQTAYTNHLNTLARRYPVHQEAPVDCSPLDDANTQLETLAEPLPEESSILMAIASAPTEIAEAIGKLVGDGEEAFRRTRLRNRNGRLIRGRRALRETTAEYYERQFGEPDLPAKVADYLYS